MIFVLIMKRIDRSRDNGKSRSESRESFMRRNQIKSQAPRVKAPPLPKPNVGDYDHRPYRDGPRPPAPGDRDGEPKVQHRTHGLAKLYDRIVGNPVPSRISGSDKRGKTSSSSRRRASSSSRRRASSPPSRKASSPPPSRASSPPPRETPSPPPTKDDDDDNDDNAYIPDPLDDPFGLKESNIVLRM